MTWNKMTEDKDPEFEFEDIDALLSEDSLVSSTGLDLEPVTAEPVATQPADSSNLGRLIARAAHAGKSLRSSLGTASNMQAALAADEEFCSQLTGDIDGWEQVLDDLSSVYDAFSNLAVEAVAPETAEALVAKALETGVLEADESTPAEPVTTTVAHEAAANYVVAESIVEGFNSDEFVEDLQESIERAFAGARVDDGEEDSILNEDILEDEPAQESAKLVVEPGKDLEKLVTEQEDKIRELEAQIATNSPARSAPGDSNRAADPYVNRLIVTSDDHGNLKFPLDQNIMTIGRDSKNDIHIRSRFISRFHARIICDQEGAIIEDMESRNGIHVNSHRVRRQQLSSGDLIDLGRTQLKYIDLTEGTSEEGEA